jgi:hypothetical protein
MSRSADAELLASRGELPDEIGEALVVGVSAGLSAKDADAVARDGVPVEEELLGAWVEEHEPGRVDGPDGVVEARRRVHSDADPMAEPTTATTAPSPPTTAPSEEGRPEATTLRFAAGATHVDVTVTDNPTTRNLISMLPLTVRFQEFNGREKIAYLP